MAGEGFVVGGVFVCVFMDLFFFVRVFSLFVCLFACLFGLNRVFVCLFMVMVVALVFVAYGVFLFVCFLKGGVFLRIFHGFSSYVCLFVYLLV